jgi:hypothetical protein
MATTGSFPVVGNNPATRTAVRVLVRTAYCTLSLSRRIPSFGTRRHSVAQRRHSLGFGQGVGQRGWLIRLCTMQSTRFHYSASKDDSESPVEAGS